LRVISFERIDPEVGIAFFSNFFYLLSCRAFKISRFFLEEPGLIMVKRNKLFFLIKNKNR